MQKLGMTFAAVLVLFSFGCSDSPLEPVSSESSAGSSYQVKLEDPGVEELSHGKAEDLPVIGFDMGKWRYVGASSDELKAVGTGVGHFSHLGKATSESVFTVSLITGVSNGTTTWTVANGDQFTTSWTSTPTSATERYLEITTTGGTGRFSDATGFTIGHLTILSSDVSGGTSEATYKGTTTY